MGVLNVTPDSFSDGGLYDTYERAVARGLEMMAGAPTWSTWAGSRRDREPSRFPSTSSWPGWCRSSRCWPIPPLPGERGVRVSVDTVKREVAEAAVAAGAGLVNDISASLWDPGRGHRRGLGGHAHAGQAAHHAGGPPLRRRGGRGRGLRPGPGRAGARPECARSGWTPGSASARRRPTTCRCCGTCPSWSRPGRAPAAPGCWWAPAANGSWACWERVGQGGAGAGGGSGRGLAGHGSWAMVAGAGMVRVHDVAATVQVARLYGPAA